MKSNLFPSPNLKLLAALASLIALLHQVVGPDGRSESTTSALASGRGLGAVQARELERMVDRTFDKPTPENYEAVSSALLRNGDVRGAFFYLRKANLAADLDL